MTDNIDKWINFYQSSDPYIQQRALASLVKFTDQRLTPILLDALVRHSMDGFGGDIVKAMIRSSDKELVEPLIKLAQHDESWIREASCEVLGSLLDRRATPVLIQCLADSEWAVRWQASFALSFLGDPVCQRAVTTRYSIEENSTVRGGLYSALRTLALLGKDVEIKVLQPVTFIETIGGGLLHAAIKDVNRRYLLLAFEHSIEHGNVQFTSALAMAQDLASYDKHYAMYISLGKAILMDLKLLEAYTTTLESLATTLPNGGYSIIASVELSEELDIKPFQAQISHT